MTRRTRRVQGFTLIEMMVAVAIIGVLATTAIALFQNYQLRSRMSEAKANLASIRDTQSAYFAEASTYVSSATCPALFGAPTNSPQNWRKVRGTICGPSVTPPNLDTLGWQPEGAPWFDYGANEGNDGDGERFTAAAYGDVDGDGNISVVLYVSPDTAGNGEPCEFCSSLSLPTLPWDPVTCQDVTNQVIQMPSSKACGHGTVPDDY